MDGNMRVFDGDEPPDGMAVVDIGAYEYASTPPVPEYGWTRRMGGTIADMANAVFVDLDDNVYIAGRAGDCDFQEDWGGGDPRTGGLGGFVTKILPDGSYGWTRKLGGIVNGGCVDRDGNVYLTGEFQDTTDFAYDWGLTDEKTTAGSYDGFLTRIAADGSYSWTRRMGGTNYDLAHAVCADVFGNVYVAGFYHSDGLNFAEDWGGSDIKDSAGMDDAFITKVDMDGNYCWTRRIGYNRGDQARAICSDYSANVYVVGTFSYDPVNFAEDWGGVDVKASNGWLDGFITKIDRDGEYCWTHTMGGSEIEIAWAVAVDRDYNIYMAGHFHKRVDFQKDWGGGEDSKLSLGEGDIFVTRINRNGSYSWTRRIGGMGQDTANGLCTDSLGNVFLTGYFSSDPDFALDWGASDPKSSAGSRDQYIMKIDSFGGYGWCYTVGTPLYEYGASVCADSNRSIYVTGFFDDSYTVNFAEDWGGTDEKTSAGSYDVYVTKITQP
jgi:hypothetical protein